MRINILNDNPKSWIIGYMEELRDLLFSFNYNVNHCTHHYELLEAELTFIIGCEQIVEEKYLHLSKHNLVIHGSALPHGRGMSPVTWQILEGKNEIPITLFEAGRDFDSGDIYIQRVIDFNGTELIDELRHKQAITVISMILEFVSQYPKILETRRKQTGKESIYRQRTPADSELDINKSIVDQFNLLRVADNYRYPAFFKHLGETYYIKITKTRP